MSTTAIGEIATLAHGYTMADVDRMASRSVKLAFAQHGDYSDRLEEAWFAIVEELYTAEQKPTSSELRRIGAQAIEKSWARHCKHRGIKGGTGENRIRAFRIYWLPVAGVDDGFAERICERIALPQMLGALTDTEYEAIAALAAFGSSALAAEALGIKLQAFQRRIWLARKHAVEVWLSPETPPKKAHTSDVTCRNGHPRAEHGARRDDGSWRCKACERATATRERARRKTRA